MCLRKPFCFQNLFFVDSLQNCPYCCLKANNLWFKITHIFSKVLVNMKWFKKSLWQKAHIWCIMLFSRSILMKISSILPLQKFWDLSIIETSFLSVILVVISVLTSLISSLDALFSVLEIHWKQYIFRSVLNFPFAFIFPF